MIRTRRPLYRSRPARVLSVATLTVAGTTVFLPYTPLAPLLGFVPLPPLVLVALLGITALYLTANELVKGVFFRRMGA